MIGAGERGLSLIEVLVAMAVLMLVGGGLFTFLIENGKVNAHERMRADVQVNAQASLTLITQQLRSAGWDPRLAGLDVVTLDPDTSDQVSQIEVFADRDGDGTTGSPMEQITIRHVGNRIEWRTTGDAGRPFDTVALGISNDADGDGVPEPMFVPDSLTDPTRVTVRVTAESPGLSPLSGEPLRYTVTNTVALRKRAG